MFQSSMLPIACKHCALRLTSELQKIRTTRYSSFSFFGILVMYILGGLILITSYSLEPILACLHRRRKYRQYAYLEWTTNETLQLHRVANEGQTGSDTTWSRCTSMVPTTASGVLLSSLDISDLKHPRFPSKDQDETPSSLDAPEGRTTTPENLEPGDPNPELDCSSAQQSQSTNEATAPDAERPQVCTPNTATMTLRPIQEQQVAQNTVSSTEIEPPSPIDDTPVQDTTQTCVETSPEQMSTGPNRVMEGSRFPHQ